MNEESLTYTCLYLHFHLLHDIQLGLEGFSLSIQKRAYNHALKNMITLNYSNRKYHKILEKELTQKLTQDHAFEASSIIQTSAQENLPLEHSNQPSITITITTRQECILQKRTQSEPDLRESQLAQRES
jgi:hypothetical protein